MDNNAKQILKRISKLKDDEEYKDIYRACRILAESSECKENLNEQDSSYISDVVKKYKKILLSNQLMKMEKKVMKKDNLKEYLKELKFDENFIDEILTYVDNEKDIESLYEKIKFLNKYGVTQEGFDIILSENPLFLTSPLETVKNSVNFLKNIKIEDVVKTLEINSELLSTSDKTMSENYKLLKILIPDEKELLRLLKIDAEILSFNTDYLEKRFEFFIKNGLKDKIKDIILNNIEAFEDDENEIDIESLK